MILSRNNNKQVVYYCQADLSDEGDVGSRAANGVRQS